jgi:dienelactone hydrolase
MDFPGALYVPADGQPHPGVLLLHGSEGGEASERIQEARKLASQGYAAMALCWFGCNAAGVPATAELVDLSRTYEAFRWFRSSQHVKARPTAFYGVGLGAEHALVLATYLAKHPEYCTPSAVIVHAPPARIRDTAPATWTWHGDLRGLQPGSPIALDRYSGGLMVTHGVEDATQAVVSSHQLEQALREAGASVRAYLHSSDPSVPPQVINPPADRGPARADFHYFEGEGAVFDPVMDSIRMDAVSAFLHDASGA